MAEGRFDISDSTESKRSRKVHLLKNLAIAILAVVVVILAISLALKRGDGFETDSDGPTDGRPLPPGGVASSHAKDRHGRDVCTNEQCISSANNLFKKMNLKADPCMDFNEFACGRFQKEFNLPEDKARWSSFTPISEVINDRAKIILEEDIKSDEWESEKMAKRAYRACMDLDKIEELGTKPLTDVLDDVLGGWPVLKGAGWSHAATFQWHQMLPKFKEAGLSSSFLVSTFVSTDDRNSSWRALFLDQPSLGLSREYLIKGIDDADVQTYLKYMKDTAVLLGASEDAAEREMTDVLKFELSIAEASAPREERRDATKLYNPYTLGDYEVLEGHPPSWTAFVNSMILGVEVTDQDRIIVQNPAYVKKLSGILKSTDPRVLANYFGWRLSKGMMAYLNEAARDIRQDYRKKIEGINKEQERWKTCVGAVGFNTYYDSNLRVAAASMYVKRHFSPEAKEETVRMISYIKSAFARMLDALDWMDAASKERAREKMRKMSEFVAYPDEILDRNVVDGFHRGLDIRNDDYLGNAVKTSRWRKGYDDSLLREKIDKKHWEKHSLVALVNAFYNPSINSMEFPAGILQGIFFDHRVPRYLNFGGIGAVIGHELTHGFDDQGRQYDGDGNLADWWEPQTKTRFVEKTKCIIGQYGSYHNEQTGLEINGVTTQGENIADNGGTKEAFMAYEDWVADNGEEAVLPGLDFTPRQLFWISWGQVWCTKYRDAAMKKQIKTGAHSPGPYRIIGPLSNSPEFAEAFKCRRGSKMNPTKKCTVW